MPEVLHALGLSESLETARLVIERDGKRSTVELRDPGPTTLMPPDTDTSFMPRPGWVDARSSTPLWLMDANSKFRLAYLGDQKLLYVQLNQVGDEKGETLAPALAALLRFDEYQGGVDPALAAIASYAPAAPLGEAWLALGDRDKALDAYRKALKMDPSSASALEGVTKLKMP